MKKHLTDEEILDLAFVKLDISNPNVDRVYEIAELLDLEYDEENNAYLNPNYIYDDKTKKGTPRKNKKGAGRPKLYNEESLELRRLVPKSQYSRIKTIIDYELDKLKIKK